MAIQGSDSIVVNRGGVDYRESAQELIPGKGDIQLKQGNTELGRFNVNQNTDLSIQIPESGVGSINGQTGDVIIDANDLNIEFPVTSVNGMTGDVLVDSGGGDVTSVNGMTGDVTVDVPVFSVNGQSGDVIILADDLNIQFPVTSVNGQSGDVTVDVPVFSVNGQTGDVVVDIPDVPVNSVNGQSGDVLLFLNDLQDVNTTGVTADQLLGWNGSSWVPTSGVSMPPSSTLKGFIDVATAAPTAAAGDLWIQHKNPAGDSVADGSWTGIAGQTITEGTYVIYSTDNRWYSGTNANDLTQIQSDYNETDQNDAAFIKNKPTIGDGDYALSAGLGVSFSGDALFSANQSTDAALSIGIDTLWFNSAVNSNVGDGKYQLSAGTGVLMSGDALFSANQSIDTGLNIGVDTVWFKNEVSSEINNQITSGKIGDGTYTVSADSGITASGALQFSANQSSDAVLELGVDSIWFSNQVASEVGNASIQFLGGQGINVSGDTPTANQKTASSTSFAVDVGDGLAFNTSDQLIADLHFLENNIELGATPHYYQETAPTQPQPGEYWFDPLTDVYAVYRENAWLQLNVVGGGGSGIEEAPDDGSLYVRQGDANDWVRGLPYDISTLPALS